MLQRAERRRRSDLVVAAAIAVAVVVGAVLYAVLGPGGNTILVMADGPIPASPPAAADVPPAVSELWRAPSPETTVPVAEGAVVVTGDNLPDGGTVAGREVMTGKVRWSYHRDRPLCAVGAAWEAPIAVFRTGEDCADVTKLEPDTGRRDRQRNSDVHPDIRFAHLGKMLAAVGADYTEVWRSDLIKTVQYGDNRTPVQPNRQPHRGCRHLGAAGTDDQLVVLERCPAEPTDRLTALKTDGEQTDKPEIGFSVLLPAAGTKLVAATPDRVAVMLPNPNRLSIRDGLGNEIASHPVDVPPGDLPGDRQGELAPSPRWALWWTGSRTIGLDLANLVPVWTRPDALGPGTVWSGRLVIPVRDGLAVLNADTGAPIRVVPVNRGDWTGPVAVRSLGAVLVEQRGPTVVALH